MKRRFEQQRVLVETFAIIAAVEMAVMLLLPHLLPGSSGVAAAALDAIVLTAVAGPLILWRGLAAARRDEAEDRADPSRSLRPLLLTVGSVLVLGIAGSVFGAWRMRDEAHAANAARFELLTERIEVETERRLRSYAYGLRGARGAIIANRSITPSRFRDYLASRDLANEFPGAMGFGYVERVPRAELPAYTKSVRATGDPDFTVSGAGSLPELHVTRLIEPPNADSATPGWDAATDAKRRETAERAMRSGETMCSSILVAGRGVDRSPDFICYLPLFREGARASTPEERGRALVGWVYVTALVGETLARLGDAASGWVDVEIYDGAETASAALLHVGRRRWPGDAYQPIEERAADWLRPKRSAIDVAGVKWTLRMAPSPAFESVLNWGTPILIGAGGVLASGLLALVFWSMGSGRVRALAMARAMTRDLQASELEAHSTLSKLAAYRAALDQHAIVVVTDAQGTITEVNDLMCELSGYPRSELIGAHRSIFDRGRPKEILSPEALAKVQGGRVHRAAYGNRGKNGRRYWVDLSVGPITDASGAFCGLVAVGSDISELKRKERELVEARDAASSSSRAKSEFLANMSHEIRTPLTAILGYADMLHEDDRDDGSPEGSLREEAIETIQAAGRHLLAIINDILDLSKIEAGKATAERIETPVLTILRELEALMRPRAASKGVTLCLRLDSPLPELVMSDPTRLRQILMNLIGNAIKFTDSGAVTVRVRAEPGGETNAPARLVIDVEDTGAGLTREQERKLFAPFSQADTTVTRQYGGTGLGLTICRRLAALMAGSVTLVHTSPGRGSCFRVDLPLEPAPGSPLATNLAASADDEPTQRVLPRARLVGRILLAEDGPDNQRLIRFLLEKAGATVALAADGAIALEMIEAAEAEDEPFDLLLTDMQMPEMDGYTLVRTLRQRGRTLPIVALTAHAMSDDRQRCIDAGCDDYASKPVDRLALLSTCSRWMGKSSRGEAVPA